MKLLIIRYLPSRPLVVLAALTLFVAYASVHNLLKEVQPTNILGTSSAQPLFPRD